MRHRQLDGVPRTQTLCGTYYSLTTVVEATALLLVQPHVKGAITVDHVTLPHVKKMAALYRMIVKELRQ